MRLWLRIFSYGLASLAVVLLDLLGVTAFAISHAFDPDALWGRVAFTLTTAPQILILVAELVTATVLLFDKDPRNDSALRARALADVYLSFWLVWAAIFMLFWTWDQSESREQFLSELGRVSPWHAFGAHLYLSATLFHGVGFGRYMATHFALEALVAVQVVIAGIFGALVFAAALSIVVENATARRKTE